MMRKLTNLIGLILLISLVIIYIIGRYENKPTPETLFYAIDTLYSETFDIKKNYHIDFYCYNKIDYQELEISLHGETTKKEYLIKELVPDKTFSYNGYKYQKIEVVFLLDYPVVEEEVKMNLRYQGQKYLLTIGQFSITNNYQLLNYSRLEGHYMYINNSLTLVGISINLLEDVVVSKIVLGNNIEIQIQNIIAKRFNDSILNEEDFIYDYHLKSEGSSNLKAGEDYFLPIYYPKLLYVSKTNLTINDEQTVEGFNFHITNKSLTEYNAYLRKGKTYA